MRYDKLEMRMGNIYYKDVCIILWWCFTRESRSLKRSLAGIPLVSLSSNHWHLWLFFCFWLATFAFEKGSHYHIPSSLFTHREPANLPGDPPDCCSIKTNLIYETFSEKPTRDLDKRQKNLETNLSYPNEICLGTFLMIMWLMVMITMLGICRWLPWTVISISLSLSLSLDYEIFAKAPCQVDSLIERVCWFTERFSLHFQAVHPIPTDIDIGIELISCFLFEISLEKLPESGTLRGGLSNAPHVRVSCLGINLYNFQACIVCTFYWLIKNQEMHANNARQGGRATRYGPAVRERVASTTWPRRLSGATPTQGRLLSSAVCYGLAPF